MNAFNIKPTKRICIPSFDSTFGPGKFKKVKDSSEFIAASSVLNSSSLPQLNMWSEWETNPRPKFHPNQQTKPNSHAEASRQLTKTFCSAVPNEQNTIHPRSMARNPNTSQQSRLLGKPVTSFPPSVFQSSSSQPTSFSMHLRLPYNTNGNGNQSYHNVEQPTNFVARPMPDFSNPFKVNYTENKSTNPLPLRMNTRTRAQNRELFDEQVRDKARKLEAQQHRIQEDRNRREKEEVLAIRKQMEFKAKPISLGSQQLPSVPLKGPTFPYGPRLLTEQRSQIREFMKMSAHNSILSESSTNFSN